LESCDYWFVFPVAAVERRSTAAMSSMITTAAWVPRGFAAPFPTKYNFDDAEFERIAELAKLQLDDANEELEEAQEEQDGHAEATAENDADQDMVDSKEEAAEEKSAEE
jgi:periodic tryptophan protein 1